jgi:hypothetical protein
LFLAGASQAPDAQEENSVVLGYGVPN